MHWAHPQQHVIAELTAKTFTVFLTREYGGGKSILCFFTIVVPSFMGKSFLKSFNLFFSCANLEVLTNVQIIIKHYFNYHILALKMVPSKSLSSPRNFFLVSESSFLKHAKKIFLRSLKNICFSTKLSSRKNLDLLIRGQLKLWKLRFVVLSRIFFFEQFQNLW